MHFIRLVKLPCNLHTRHNAKASTGINFPEVNPCSSLFSSYSNKDDSRDSFAVKSYLPRCCSSRLSECERAAFSGAGIVIYLLREEQLQLLCARITGLLLMQPASPRNWRSCTLMEMSFGLIVETQLSSA